MRFSIVAVLAAALVAGCAPSTIIEPEVEAAVGYPHHDLTQILMKMEAVAEADELHAYSSQASVSLRSPDQNMSGMALIRQRGADSVWASVRGPLNIEGARALVTVDSFKVIDRLRGRMLVGTAAAAQQIFPGATGPEEVFRAVTGTLLPDPGIRWIVNATTLEGHEIYWLSAPDASQRIAVDPTVWRIRRLERLSGGTVVDRRRYDDFVMREGRVLPASVELSNPSAETTLSLEHRRLDLNPTDLPMPFDPGNATVVPISPPPGSN